ncbi:hypothetical protein BHE74_00034095 [Ensete ventricosum]|nr:hypothetical protein BHE74_00034095 [Ensete ventricosum]
MNVSGLESLTLKTSHPLLDVGPTGALVGPAMAFRRCRPWDHHPALPSKHTRTVPVRPRSDEGLQLPRPFRRVAVVVMAEPARREGGGVRLKLDRMGDDLGLGYWSGGAPVGKKSPSSGRPSILARRPSRVGSRRDPSNGRVNLVVHFSIPLPRKGAGAFIVSVVDHSYLLLWPIMPSYPSTTLAVHVVRRAFTGRGSTLPVSGRLYDH